MVAWSERIRWGVIDDARERHGRERRRVILVAALLAIAIVVPVAVAASGGGPSGGGEPTTVSFAGDHFSAGGMPASITLTVYPVPGGATASFRYDGSYVIDDNVPARGPRVLVRWDSRPPARSTRGRFMFAIVGPGVAAVRAGRYGVFKTEHVDDLPPGYKTVVFYYPNSPALAREHARTRQGMMRVTRQITRRETLLPRLVPLTPLNAAGKATAAGSTAN
jgi:hypothetical protein